MTGWKIDINSESELELTSRKVIDELIENLKISDILARILYDEYLREPRDIAKLTPEEMNKITSISVDDCIRIIERAKLIKDAVIEERRLKLFQRKKTSLFRHQKMTKQPIMFQLSNKIFG